MKGQLKVRLKNGQKGFVEVSIKNYNFIPNEKEIDAGQN